MTRRFLKSLVAAFLALFARRIVRRYKPKVVMVAGSVGKTTTKDAVAAALSGRYYVRKSEKNFNTEFGVPYTIFGITTDPVKNPLAWFSVLKSALALTLLPNHYPNLLVLEVGAEEPGDLAKLVDIARPDAVVITRLPEIPVHVEAYESPEAVREEEFSPAYALAPSAPLIIAADDPYAASMAKRTPAHVISYGMDEEADVRISRIGFHSEDGAVDGMQAQVDRNGEEKTVVVAGSVGRTQVLPVAAALATATALGMTTAEALTALQSFVPPAGRGRLFVGVHGSVVIDDSYNSSPAAVEEALETLAAFPGAKRRIAVLGDMLELGRYSVREHERIGALAVERADVVVAVGIRARAFTRVAGGKTLEEDKVLAFDDSRAAARALPDFLREGDVVLVKGSQSVRTERIVAALLADQSDRALLVRQARHWLRRS